MTLMVNHLVGFGDQVTANPLTLTYIGRSSYTGGNINPISIASVNIGTASSDRLVIITFTMSTNGGAAAQFNSATIGGNAATVHAASSGNRGPVGIASLVVASGTTATVTFGTAATSGTDAILDVWTLTGWSSSTPSDTAVDQNASASSLTNNIDIASNGIAVFAASKWNNANNATFSSATEDASGAVGVSYMEGARKLGPVTAHDETASWTTAAVCGMVSASWS